MFDDCKDTVFSDDMNIEAIFEDMNYGSEFESVKEAKEWIEAHQAAFSSFISGNYKLISSGQKTDLIDVSTYGELTKIEHNDRHLLEAVESANEAQRQWLKVPALNKTLFLNNLAKCLQRKSDLLAKLESLSTGRLIKQVQNVIIPRVVRHFQYFAGWPGLLLAKKKNLKPLGTVIVCVSANSSLSVAIQKVAPALAAGNSIVLYLDGSRLDNIVNLGFYCLAELLHECSFPAGILNVVYAEKTLNLSDELCRVVGGVTYVGTLQRGREICQRAVVSAVRLSQTFEHTFSAVIFETADVDSAVDAVTQMIKTSFEQEFITRILVQESIYKKFFQLLKEHFNALRFGNALDLTVDVGPITKSALQDLIEKLKQVNVDDVLQFCFPCLDILPFRTAKEAVELVNDSLLDIRASVWTENVTLAMEVTRNIQASVIWINSFNEFDAGVEVCNRKLSGGGQDCGERSLYQYIQPVWCETTQHDRTSVANHNAQNFESIKKAVDVSHKSQIGWHNVGAIGRSKVLFDTLEVFLKGKTTLVEKCVLVFDSTAGKATEEVDNVAQQLYFWASCCDKSKGKIKDTGFKGRILNICEPLGVIAIILPNECPLVTCAPLLFSAISLGNAVVVFSGGKISMVLSSLIQQLVSGGLPNGIINLITENSDAVLSSISKEYVNAVWYFGSKSGLQSVTQCASQDNTPPVWAYCLADVNSAELLVFDTDELYYRATQSKVIWVPSGVTFAN